MPLLLHARSSSEKGNLVEMEEWKEQSKTIFLPHRASKSVQSFWLAGKLIFKLIHSTQSQSINCPYIIQTKGNVRRTCSTRTNLWLITRESFVQFCSPTLLGLDGISQSHKYKSYHFTSSPTSQPPPQPYGTSCHLFQGPIGGAILPLDSTRLDDEVQCTKSKQIAHFIYISTQHAQFELHTHRHIRFDHYRYSCSILNKHTGRTTIDSAKWNAFSPTQKRSLLTNNVMILALTHSHFRYRCCSIL